MKNEQMALLFSEATPYIQKYHGKTLVIKYGGNAMVNDDLKLAVMNDLVTLTLLGVRALGRGAVQPRRERVIRVCHGSVRLPCAAAFAAARYRPPRPRRGERSPPAEG